MKYEPNRKHKEPWQPGRKGSLCPSHISEEDRDRLLAESEEDPTGAGKRFATDGSRAYCAQEHRPGVYHGYPVGWREVPEKLRRQWLAAGKVKKREIALFWKGD